VLSAATPFVLFDAAPGRLYSGPVEIVETRDPEQVQACLGRLRGAAARGLHAAGFLSYEAGYSLEAKLKPLRADPDEHGSPLLWFGLFDGFRQVDVEALLPDKAGAFAAAPRPLVARADYDAALASVKAHIDAGNVYQANLTFPAEVLVAGSPLAICASIRERAQAGHGAIVFTGAHWLLSFSPESFFTLEAGKLTTRPMKGTALRRPDDVAAVEALRNDPKQRAENLMIVDLLRNDLSRVSRTGSVAVPSLFAVETYPTIHQMTSTITSELEDGLGPVDVIAAIFPCGSITGAPKIRAMELIAGLESSPRGPYTGSIGWIDPAGDAAFNVAIRTLTLDKSGERATLGLGSGIVADSEAGAEWRECLAKGRFVASAGFDLIETMRFDPLGGIFELDRHLERMKASAEAFGFPFHRHDARNELQAATFRHREPRKLRMLLSPSGALAIESRAPPEAPSAPVEVAIVPRPVAADDVRLRHKTSDRGFYDDARRGAGAFEILFVDEQGYLTEGSFTHLFVARDGILLTPPLARGLLPGILRARLLAEGEAVERELVAADLQDGFLIGNAVRGLVPARLVQVLPPGAASFSRGSA